MDIPIPENIPLQNTRPWLKKNYPDFYESINHPGKITEILYKYFFGEHRCPICGKPTKFINFNHGYHKYCSCKCRSVGEQKNIEKIFKDKYGCHPRQLQSTKDKQKQTCLDRYGVDNPMKSKQIQEKLKQTNKERMGVDWPFESKTIQQKARQTCLDRYGSTTFIDKSVETHMQKYGVPYGFLLHQKGYSEISQQIFKYIDTFFEGYDTYYGSKNTEYRIGPYKLDYYIPELKAAIEFNGDRWHANPRLYTSNDCPKPHYPDLTASEIWEKDISRMTYIMSQGINVYVIWENDIKHNNYEVIDSIIKEIYENKRLDS